MSATDVAKATMNALQAHDMAAASALMTDDFTFSGAVPVPLNKQQYLGVQWALFAAIPNWNFNASNYEEQGDKVILTVQITGTQTGTLENVIPGVPPIPPTGKSFQLPQEHVTLTVRGDKIANESVESVPNGGAPGIFAQLGHPLPPMG
ncbi:MAG: nuclear transport factor 2 family protein [Ktedonobacterales bacterium]|nr:nuclear transport factor 2 family protein [Ktedonobacterales bacterium]